MSRLPSIAITSGLIGCGVLAWALAGRPLTANKNLAVPLNPMGINGSPYGQVFAMALQGPISNEFHLGVVGTSGCNCGDPSHDHGDHSCPVHDATTESTTADNSPTGRMKHLIATMAKANKERTNPKPPSKAQKLYLSRQAEEKLRFAYRLDPSHYANYAALHLFLVENLGKHSDIATRYAAKLGDETIQYCLKQKSDPRPSLTAAAACTHMLQIMFEDQKSAEPRFDAAIMRQYLDLLDYCIAHYVTIAKQWDQNGNWELLSPMRIQECDDRLTFITRIREACEKTIIRIENGSSSSAESSTVGNSPTIHRNS
ncbi:MAG: hypothetical protein Q7R22_017950 [Verrucomicrobiota bacterium JB025]|nr:hypothetical protein [Verrucomicrobiota bacterium JB025]